MYVLNVQESKKYLVTFFILILVSIFMLTTSKHMFINFLHITCNIACHFQKIDKHNLLLKFFSKFRGISTKPITTI